jgi:hypothetical protein
VGVVTPPQPYNNALKRDMSLSQISPLIRG